RQIGGNGEEPRPDIGVRRQRPVCLVRSHKGLLGQVVGIARARSRAHEIAMYLGMMRRHDGLEWILSHVPDHETPYRPRCEMARALPEAGERGIMSGHGVSP